MSSNIIYEHTIQIPKILNPIGIVDLSSKIRDLPIARNYIFDFRQTTKAFPFGMLVTSRMINHVCDRIREQCKMEGLCPKIHLNYIPKSNVAGYLSHVGYFRSIGFDIGKDVGEAFGSNSYVPLTCIGFDELRKKYEGIHYCDAIEMESSRLAAVFDECNKECTNNKDSYSHSALTYLIREIIRNSYEHSEGKAVYICGQFLKTKQISEIAIVDEGLGVFRTIRKHHKVGTHSEALEQSLFPGVSGATIDQKNEDKCANSGYGLYMASTLCTLNAASQFMIASGDSMLLVKEKTKKQYSIAPLKGTAVMINLHVTNQIDFDECLTNILKTGSQIAKEAGHNPSASMASKLASLRRRIQAAN